MTDSENPASEPKIKSDEDWKQQIKAEDARLDAARAQASQSQARPTEADHMPPENDAAQLPPPEFNTLVGLLSTRALVSLGMISYSEDDKPEVQLPLARHFIDLLGVLQEKTRGNLTDVEEKLLEKSLHELRMVYLELSRAK